MIGSSGWGLCVELNVAGSNLALCLDIFFFTCRNSLQAIPARSQYSMLHLGIEGFTVHVYDHVHVIEL